MNRITTTLLVQIALCLGLGLGVARAVGVPDLGNGQGCHGSRHSRRRGYRHTNRHRSYSHRQTEANGSYSLPSLPLGPYRMEVKKNGFTTYVQAGIVLQVDSAQTIDRAENGRGQRIGPGRSISGTMVETHSTGVGQVVNQQQVVELP